MCTKSDRSGTNSSKHATVGFYCKSSHAALTGMTDFFKSKGIVYPPFF